MLRTSQGGTVMDGTGKRTMAVAVLLLVSTAAFAVPNGDLRLVQAAKNKDREMVRSLLQEKAEVNAPEPDGTTALAWAAHWDDLEMADRLIGAGANPNLANDYGVPPL